MTERTERQRRPIPAGPRTPSDTVADRVRQFRKRRGWDLHRLAAECAAVGAPGLSAAVLANVESGRRDPHGRRRREVTIDELLALAYVLAVPPTLLFIPLGTDDEVAILPTVTVHPDLALAWVEGHEPPVGSDRRVRDAEEWDAAAAPLRLYRALRTAQALTDRAFLAVRTTEQRIAYVGRATPELEETLGAQREEYVVALGELADVLARMTERALRPPAIARGYVDTMRSLGIPVPEAVRIFEDIHGEKED
jgi:transcriptional regulator with XRE-family HTH domain